MLQEKRRLAQEHPVILSQIQAMPRFKLLEAFSFYYRAVALENGLFDALKRYALD
jgi:hypothetical protein